MATVAQIVAEHLQQANCRYAFGIPGGEVLDIMQALTEQGVAFHLCKHENAGGFMAEGTSHATGAPGILLATIGPGLVNAYNCVMNALQDQVPLIVISGTISQEERLTYTHQVFDQSAALKEAVKASITLCEGVVDLQMEKALAIAMSDPPGPVHIDIPTSIAGKEQTERQRNRFSVARHGVPALDEHFQEAVERINKAEMPVALAGVGVLHHQAEEALKGFCLQHKIPLVTTYKAKGILDEHEPLCLGGHGLSPRSDKIVLPLLKQSDCVLLIGYDPIEMRSGWIEPFGPQNAIEFSNVQPLHGMHLAGLSFVGDLKQSIAQLSSHLKRAQPIPSVVSSAKRELDKFFEGPSDWGPHQVFAGLREAAPDDIVLTIDSGAHRILLSQRWKATRPRTVFQSTALCTMGYSLPAAMGYKIASPSTPVVAVAGDAGLEMVMGELATLRDMGLPLVILILVDESLALIELKQKRSQMPRVGVRFGDTDFPSVARAFGGHGVWVDDKETLKKEISEGFSRSTFTLLAARIRAEDYDGSF